MSAAGGVFVPHFGEQPLGQADRQLNQRRPKAAVDIGDLAVDELADEHVRTLTHCSSGSKYCPPLRVTPPTPADRGARNCLRKTRHRAAGGLEDDPVAFNEVDGFPRVHTSWVPTRNIAINNFSSKPSGEIKISMSVIAAAFAFKQTGLIAHDIIKLTQRLLELKPD